MIPAMTVLRDALRGLRTGRGTAILACAIFTLAIAAGTVTFSVVDAIALRSLPFNRPDLLVAIARIDRHGRDPSSEARGVIGSAGGAAGRVTARRYTTHALPIISAVPTRILISNAQTFVMSGVGTTLDAIARLVVTIPHAAATRRPAFQALPNRYR
jgi:hypothetical protein